MYILESILENETDKILWYFEVRTDTLILSRRADLVMMNKKENLPNIELCRPSRQKKKKRKKIKEKEKRD